MRIAVFIKSTTFNDNYGGLETQNKLLVEGLAEAGNEVVVVAPGRGETSGIKSAETPEVRESAGVKYILIDSPIGKYSKEWFEKSVEVFKKLHKKEPFDAVISQSMAGQRVVNYIKKNGRLYRRPDKSGLLQSDIYNRSHSGASPASPAGRPKGEAIESTTNGFGKRPACIVIQHGTILGELKTRWKSLSVPRENFRVSKNRSIKDLAQNVKEFLFFFFRLVPYGLKIYIQDQIRLRKADKIIAVSDLVKDSLVREYFLPEEKVAVVYNGIELEKFEIRKKSEIASNNSECQEEAGQWPAATEDTNVAAPHGAPNTERVLNSPGLPGLGNLREWEDGQVLLYVGRVEKEKGLGKLLEAVSNFRFKSAGWRKNLKLIIVGDGEYLADLKKLAKELDVDEGVIFTGKVPYENVPDYYAVADVFVLPSLRQEGLPMTLPEAMASGLPVVASRIGGIPNAVQDGATGLLVEPGNVEELSQALNDILSSDELVRDMGENGRDLAKNRFSQKAMVERTLAIIQSMMQ